MNDQEKLVKLLSDIDRAVTDKSNAVMDEELLEKKQAQVNTIDKILLWNRNL